jgi:hypothetical protein
MITPTFKTKIKEILGGHYAPKIILHLTERNILNARNKPFSNESIQKIVSGIQPHETVEFEILKLLELTQKRKEKLQAKINKKSSF